MATTKKYFHTVAKNEGITVEYKSEHDDLTIHIERSLNSGDLLGVDSLTIHATYVEPLIKLLREVNPHKGTDNE